MDGFDLARKECCKAQPEKVGKGTGRPVAGLSFPSPGKA